LALKLDIRIPEETTRLVPAGWEKHVDNQSDFVFVLSGRFAWLAF
jgi:hypothetical protein